MLNPRVAVLAIAVIGGSAFSKPQVESTEQWPTCYATEYECEQGYAQCCSPGFPVCSGSTILCETQYMIVDCLGGDDTWRQRCNL